MGPGHIHRTASQPAKAAGPGTTRRLLSRSESSIEEDIARNVEGLYNSMERLQAIFDFLDTDGDGLIDRLVYDFLLCILRRFSVRTRGNSGNFTL